MISGPIGAHSRPAAAVLQDPDTRPCAPTNTSLTISVSLRSRAVDNTDVFFEMPGFSVVRSTGMYRPGSSQSIATLSMLNRRRILFVDHERARWGRDRVRRYRAARHGGLGGRLRLFAMLDGVTNLVLGLDAHPQPRSFLAHSLRARHDRLRIDPLRVRSAISTRNHRRATHG